MLKSFYTRSRGLLLLAAGVALFSAQTQAVVLWDESSSGDLSDNQAAPSTFTLGIGSNNVTGTVNGGTDSQDWLAFTVAAGLQLSSVTLVSYTSTDAQGFTGVQSGTAFVGSPFDAGSYLGYAHYGTGAQNGSLPTANLVGVDILPIMGDNVNAAPGSQGFTPPLGSGNYAFLIQQLGASTIYQFDYAVTAVPEPRSQAVLALLCGAFALARRFAKARQSSGPSRL